MSVRVVPKGRFNIPFKATRLLGFPGYSFAPKLSLSQRFSGLPRALSVFAPRRCSQGWTTRIELATTRATTVRSTIELRPPRCYSSSGSGGQGSSHSSRGIYGDADASRGAGVGKTERKGATAIQTLASSYLICSEHPRQDLNLQYPGPKPGALSVELRGLKKSINIVGYHPTGLFVSRHRGKSPAKS